MVSDIVVVSTSISGNVGLSLGIAVTGPSNAHHEVVTLQLIPDEKLQEMKT